MKTLGHRFDYLPDEPPVRLSNLVRFPPGHARLLWWWIAVPLAGSSTANMFRTSYHGEKAVKTAPGFSVPTTMDGAFHAANSTPNRLSTMLDLHGKYPISTQGVESISFRCAGACFH